MNRILGTALAISLAVGVVTSTPAQALSSSGSSGLVETGKQFLEPPGSRHNPHDWGTPFTSGDWEITVNHVDLFADETVVAAHPLNTPADEGFTYIMVNLTATNLGDEREGTSPYWFHIDYISGTGDTYSEMDTVALGPGPFDFHTDRYHGQSVTGNVVIAVPAEGLTRGTVSVSAGYEEEKGYYPVSS